MYRPCLLLLALCLAAAPFAYAADEPYTRTENLVYDVQHGTGLVMDVFVPKENKNGLAIVDTLSGAWFSDRAQLNDHMNAGIFAQMCGKGFTVFMVRPGSRTKWTGEEMVENLKTGIRYVKAHAAEYGIDPDRLGLTGASAGGHLSLLTSLQPEPANPNATRSLDRFGTDVAAVAVFFPPTDFLDWGGAPSSGERIGDVLFAGGVAGKTEDEITEKMRALSPISYVKPGQFPPFLIIHGDADPAVPLQQSEKITAAMKEAGIQVELRVKPGGEHPWPTIYEEVGDFANWFAAQLGADAAAPASK